MKYAFGADVGGTTVKLGLFTEAGDLIEKWEIPTDTSDGGVRVLPDITAAIRQKLAEKKIEDENVLGVGFGLPGAVLEDGTVNKCVNLGWGVFNIVDEFKRLSGFDSFAGNDATVAALGEVWKGGGRGHRNAVMVTLGTGVGGGIIVNEKIYAGTFGAGGEIGHIPMNDDEEETCGCGKKGCLEQYSSASGLARVAGRILRESREESLLRGLEKITARDVCDCARQGDGVAQKAISYSMSLLGKAMASIACVIDPEVFIIGGGLSKSGDLILDPIRESYQKHVFHACRNTKITLAEMGNDAGIFGAVKLVLDAR